MTCRGRDFFFHNFFPHEPAAVHKKMQRSFAGSGRALLALLCHAWHPLTAGFAPGVAVVTGGNRGIGLEVCRQLVDRGFTVVLTARDPERGEKQGKHRVAAQLSAHAGGPASMTTALTVSVMTARPCRSARGAGHRARGGSRGRGERWARGDSIPPAGHHGCGFHRQVCTPRVNDLGAELSRAACGTLPSS